MIEITFRGMLVEYDQGTDKVSVGGESPIPFKDAPWQVRAAVIHEVQKLQRQREQAKKKNP